MKFTLTHDGELRSNDNPGRKWEIRKKLHPQLEELWTTNATLKQVAARRFWPIGGAFSVSHHHTENLAAAAPSPPAMMSNTPENTIDLCSTVVKGGKHFLPLVRKSYLLTCALKIIF